MVESEGILVATGDVTCDYNLPSGDLSMAVSEAYRRHGFGSYLVQELKRIADEIGQIPAARCNIAHTAFRRTLQKAGMLPCCRLLVGEVVR